MDFSSRLGIVWQTVVSVYRRFLHYTVFRFLLWLYAAVLGTVFSLPFIVCVVGAIFFFQLGQLALLFNVNMPMADSLALLASFGLPILLLLLLSALIACIYVFAFSYVHFLLYAGFGSYTEKTDFKATLKPNVFSFAQFKRVFDVLIWIGIYYLIPLAVVLASLLCMLAFNITRDGSILLAIVSAIVMMFAVGLFSYYTVRLLFAFPVLASSPVSVSGRECVRRSFMVSR